MEVVENHFLAWSRADGECGLSVGKAWDNSGQLWKVLKIIAPIHRRALVKHSKTGVAHSLTNRACGRKTTYLRAKKAAAKPKNRAQRRRWELFEN